MGIQLSLGGSASSDPNGDTLTYCWVIRFFSKKIALITKVVNRCTAHTGAFTLIQRFGGAMNLNVHFHMLFLDGDYVDSAGSSTRFRWVKAPTNSELDQLSRTIAHRLARYLERQGLLDRSACTVT